MKTNEQLNKIFITQIVAFTVAILLISAFLFYQLSIKHLEERALSDYRAEMELLAGEVNYKALLAVEDVRALSSRTMIRRELYKYHIGDITLEELRKYTLAKYIDGASVYGNILVAVRKDITGTIIARFSKENIRIPDGFEDKDLSFIKNNSGYNLLIRNRIVHEGSLIGYDTVLFNFNNISEGKGKHIETIELRESMVSEGERPKYGLSVPVGGTGWFLNSTFNRATLEEERGRIIKTALLLSLMLIMAVLVVSYFTILRLSLRLLGERDETNSRLNESILEKEYLLKELHHRVKNNLTLISSFLHLQSSETDNKELIDRNSVLDSRINAISLVHQKLQCGEGSMEVEMGDYLEDLGNMIIKSNGMVNIGLVVQKSMEFVLPAKQIIPIGLIFTELIINSIKHAAGDDGLRIRLDIEKENDSLLLRFNDDGRPFPEGFDIRHTGTLGFSIIRNLVEQLDGIINQDLSSGKEIRIVLSRAAVSARFG